MKPKLSLALIPLLALSLAIPGSMFAPQWVFTRDGNDDCGSGAVTEARDETSASVASDCDNGDASASMATAGSASAGTAASGGSAAAAAVAS